MSKIEGLVLQIVRYAEKVKDASDSEARYNAAFELKLTAVISKRRSGSTDGGGSTCLIDAMNTTNLQYIVIWRAREAKSEVVSWHPTLDVAERGCAELGRDPKHGGDRCSVPLGRIRSMGRATVSEASSLCGTGFPNPVRATTTDTYERLHDKVKGSV
jgi:hypothetical protein